jgi:hypothetical protein
MDAVAQMRFEIYDENGEGPEPRSGFVVAMSEMPKCDFCEEEARFDFMANLRPGGGPWAYACREHYFKHRAYPMLGVGFGQRLVPR